jgi:hypothetical protein
VRQIDQIHNTKDKRQAGRYQEQHQSELQAIESLHQKLQRAHVAVSLVTPNLFPGEMPAESDTSSGGTAHLNGYHFIGHSDA